MQQVCIAPCRSLQRIVPLATSQAAIVHQIVPKASGVADRAHPVVPPASAVASGVSAALVCQKTGATCPALAALFSSLAPAGAEAAAWIQRLAPCPECRVAFESGRDGLRHVRLGQREREILIGASAGGVLTITTPEMSRSLSAARRRAALSLVKAGLVEPAAPRSRAEQAPDAARPRRAAVTLTPLGRYALEAYGRFLKAGAPVRWTRPLRGIALPGRDPSELRDETLGRCQSALRTTLGELMGVLAAAVARPHKDPGLLENVTRHLEQKADLLRAVLAPAAAATSPGGSR
jgi:hypothetical protein